MVEKQRPAKAHPDMYLDKSGKIIPKVSLNGPLAAGIPGQAAALVHLSKQYGKLPLTASPKTCYLSCTAWLSYHSQNTKVSEV